ncbi:MAG: trypsin-like peptidase domain-containing protein [Acidimicrobiales bacterium]|nr:trypsin-like peptidase domain-containing protein [Acidimicrobiales bacterium]
MPTDDDADDDVTGFGAPLPPDDRLWRHPSELGRHASGDEVAGGRRRRSGRTATLPVALIAGLAGAVLSTGIIAVTGHLSPRVIERQVVERVAVTPMVSSPMVRGDRGVAKVASQMSPAIVRLDVTRDGTTATGSGVVFRDDGLVLTSAHVVEGADDIHVRLDNGRNLAGTLVGADALTDVAVLDVDARDVPVALLGSAAALEVGEPAVAIGSPLGLRGGPSVTTGVISAVDRTVDGPDGSLHGMIQTDAPIAPGSSGGALVDSTGAVVGIITAKATEAGDRFGFATPIDLARRVADELVQRGAASHGWIGVEGVDLPPDQAGAMGVEGGALVRGVLGDGPAKAAGLAQDDVITEVNGEPIESMPDLVVELREHRPGEEVKVGYWRKGKRSEASVIVDDRPPAPPSARPDR